MRLNLLSPSRCRYLDLDSSDLPCLYLSGLSDLAAVNLTPLLGAKISNVGGPNNIKITHRFYTGGGKEPMELERSLGDPIPLQTYWDWPLDGTLAGRKRPFFGL